MQRGNVKQIVLLLNQCTDPGLVSNVKRLSLFCIVEDERERNTRL